MAHTIMINGKEVEVKVINTDDQSKYISEADAEMDARAKKAIEAAIEKAKVCKKPIARYDADLKKAYLEYPNGDKVYEN